MKHFFRTQMLPTDVLAAADTFFPDIELVRTGTAARARTFAGPLGEIQLSVRKEGGHYTLIDVVTDQTGESRLDRNVKRFFVTLHRTADPAHALEASY